MTTIKKRESVRFEKEAKALKKNLQKRKKQEKELIKTFKEYKEYQKRVGMFFPKIIKKRVK